MPTAEHARSSSVGHEDGDALRPMSGAMTDWSFANSLANPIAPCTHGGPHRQHPLHLPASRFPYAINQVPWPLVSPSQPPTAAPLLTAKAANRVLPQRRQRIQYTFDRNVGSSQTQGISSQPSSPSPRERSSDIPSSPPSGTFGPSFGEVFGCASGDHSGHLFSRDVLEQQRAQTLAGAPDLSVYLSPGYGLPAASTKRDAIQQRNAYERERACLLAEAEMRPRRHTLGDIHAREADSSEVNHWWQRQKHLTGRHGYSTPHSGRRRSRVSYSPSDKSSIRTPRRKRGSWINSGESHWMLRLGEYVRREVTLSPRSEADQERLIASPPHTHVKRPRQHFPLNNFTLRRFADHQSSSPIHPTDRIERVHNAAAALREGRRSAGLETLCPAAESQLIYDHLAGGAWAVNGGRRLSVIESGDSSSITQDTSTQYSGGSVEPGEALRLAGVSEPPPSLRDNDVGDGSEPFAYSLAQTQDTTWPDSSVPIAAGDLSFLDLGSEEIDTSSVPPGRIHDGPSGPPPTGTLPATSLPEYSPISRNSHGRLLAPPKAPTRLGSPFPLGASRRSLSPGGPSPSRSQSHQDRESALNGAEYPEYLVQLAQWQAGLRHSPPVSSSHVDTANQASAVFEKSTVEGALPSEFASSCASRSSAESGHLLDGAPGSDNGIYLASPSSPTFFRSIFVYPEDETCIEGADPTLAGILCASTPCPNRPAKKHFPSPRAALKRLSSNVSLWRRGDSSSHTADRHSIFKAARESGAGDSSPSDTLIATFPCEKPGVAGRALSPQSKRSSFFNLRGRSNQGKASTQHFDQNEVIARLAATAPSAASQPHLRGQVSDVTMRTASPLLTSASEDEKENDDTVALREAACATSSSIWPAANPLAQHTLLGHKDSDVSMRSARS